MGWYCTRFILLLGALAGQPACGGAPSPRLVSTVSPEVSELSFFLDTRSLKGPTGAAVAALLRTALLDAGFVLGAEGAGPADAMLDVRVTQEPALLQVRINGRQRGEDHVYVTVSLRADGSVVDEVATDFSSPDGEVHLENLLPIVDALRQSPRVQDWAAWRLAHRDAASVDEAAQPPAEATPPGEHTADAAD